MTSKGAALKMDDTYSDEAAAREDMMRRYRTAVDRLAAYEDTGLMPEEITAGTPPCYKPDGDGCAYQVYDGDDEPIDRCKECPLCYSDKQRHQSPPNDPLTLEELREMDGEPVWVERRDGGISGWAIFGDMQSPYGVYCGTARGGLRLPYDDYSKTWLAYRRKPEEGVTQSNA